MSYYDAEVTAYVKGGMPIVVRATVDSDESGSSVTDMRLFWTNTGKAVTPKFEASLTESDWNKIMEALAE